MKRRLAIVIAFLFVALGTLAVLCTDAYAHHAILSGTATCSNSDHVIAWSIGNSQPKEDMGIVSATAELGGAHYAVTGYTNPVAPSGSTSASTTIPGTLTGQVTLWVHGVWTDGHTSQRHVSVDLPATCAAVTTTTLAPTTTIPSPTTTSEVTSPRVPAPTTAPKPIAAPTGVDGGAGTPPQLAFTGASVAVLGVVGFGVLALGLALVRPGRRKVFGER